MKKKFNKKSISKAIILAGGSNTRMWPASSVISKQLLPIYDKPMIYYSISTVMLMGIKDILIISTSKDINKFESLLGDGKKYGIKILYKIQSKPKGIAESLIIGEKFINNKNFVLLLGDNIFFGAQLGEYLKKCANQLQINGAINFLSYTNNPQDYGIAKISKSKVTQIIEKPKRFVSNWAVTGLYFFSPAAVSVAKKIKPSKRGELEITAVNNYFLKKKKLSCNMLSRGFAWIDAGTYDTINEASNFIRLIEKRQGLKVGCIEEVAYRQKYISIMDFKKIIKEVKSPSYSDYLKSILE
jgi:glucose-1-phosphate thymidylyltransferase